VSETAVWTVLLVAISLSLFDTELTTTLTFTGLESASAGNPTGMQENEVGEQAVTSHAELVLSAKVA
jgi:hypothetical protein